MIHSDFNDDIDWSVYKHQQSPPKSASKSNPDFEDRDLGSKNKSSSDMVDTFIGKLPRHSQEFQFGTDENKKLMEEMINAGIGAPGMKMIEAVSPAIKKGGQIAIDYMQPGKEAEKFRSSLGEGTSKENIERLSETAQSAKRSAKENALIPKAELYSKEGKSNVYNINPKELPEGNLGKMAEMVDPGGEFSQSQMKSLANAIKGYRKTGKIDSFLDKSEEIFNVAELPEKAAAKIEDALLMPVKRDSKYFADSDVAGVYSPKGNLMNLHKAYEKKPTLANYDALQSALKKELREMKGREKLSDTATPKVDQLKTNIKNLDQDKQRFMDTLPENMQNLENEFRTKYKDYAQTYEKGKKEVGPSLTLRRLAEGRPDLVTDAAVVKLFSNPTAADKKALLDMGESAGRNALYSALQKVPARDAEKMAETILDLKRTKGFDKIVTKEIENWANNMLKHVSHVDKIKTVLGSAAGATLGGLAGGGTGAAVGMVAPALFKGAKSGAQLGAKYLSKYLKK